MFKKINALIFLILIVGTGKLIAQFPYYESFKNSTAPDIVFGGQPTAYLTSGQNDPVTGVTDPVGEGYLRLTRNRGDQKGFVHNKTNFSSQYGLKIEFEYFTYGGGAFGVSADGITFFLYDATVSDNNFKIGGFGGSLGYAQYKTSSDAVATSGITGGYLGIGLDEYGNFSNPTELRVGGPGFLKSSVTLRGRGEGSGPTLPNSSLGNYRYLTHKQTTPVFGLTSGSRSPLPTSNDYRKAIIILEPARNPLTGYFVTVKIVTGGNPQTTHTVIDQFHYPDIAPAQVRYGLASSTGFEYNYHEIRNLRINAFDPIPPVASNDLNNTTAKNTPVAIPVLDNDVDQNGDIVPSTLIITSQTQGATIVKNPTTGVITYTPPPGFIGKDTFFYTVTDEEGAVSNIAKVEVDVISVKPTGLPDNSTTTINTPVTISVLTNDPSKTDVTVIPDSSPVQGGTVVINTDNTIRYTPPNGFTGNVSFTYRLRNGDGLVSDPITVTVYIQRPPVANNDNATTLMDQSVSIDLPANDTDPDGTVNKSTVVIKTPPANGSLGRPDAQGNIVYTPNFGYVGIDVFTYTIKDDKDAESAPATVTISISSVPKIGLSKALTSIRNSVNGSFIVRFTFTIGNYGKESLEKISLKDNLALSFAGTQIKVVSISPTGTLTANSNFDGIVDTEMLSQASNLAAGKIESVELILSVVLLKSEGTFQNTALAAGFSAINGAKATDASVAGVNPDPFTPGDVTPSGPTFFELKKGPLYIPEGFSPNNDGINDLFIVSNSQGKKIFLDVYNRWGNRVYKSTSYQNDWDGRCSEGIYVGQDLPSGTYYYIVVIDDTDKHMGYITINR